MSEKNNQKIYACFGGFSDQYWTKLSSPDIRGYCDGLTVCEMDMGTGKMEIVSQSHGVDSPSTLVVSPDQKYIYAGNEGHDYKGRGMGGGLTAYRFDMKTKEVELINESYAFGGSTCYVTLDRTGKYLFVANGGSKFYVTRVEEKDGEFVPVVLRDEGCVCVFNIREDGGIGKLVDRLVLTGTGIDPVEHASAHPHSILVNEEDDVIIPNKGGDDIYVGKFNRVSEKIEIRSIFKTEFGSSPRHAAFVKGTPYVLVQNEYDGHINSYELDRERGELRRISRLDTIIEDLPIPENQLFGKKHPWGIDVQVHPNGRFVFTNNTQVSVNTFEINDRGELKLKFQYHLDVPSMTRGMQIDREGKYLVVTGVMNEKSYIFSIDQEDGHLTLASDIKLPTPTALRFLYLEN